MSLFLPSNLSPNFQEVVSNISGTDDNTSASIDFQFQVNSNGSCVRSYKLEILNGRNDADVPDDNILATFYGVFDKPLYNKDIYTITLTDNQISQQKQMTLEIPKDYRWRLRLYEDIIDNNSETINIQTVYGNTYVGAGHIVGTTKNVIWLNKIDNNIVEDKYVQTVLYSHDNTNDFNPFNEKKIKDKEDELNLLEENQRGIRINSSYENLGILNGLQLKTNSRGDQIVTGIVIDINEILPEYIKKITDGNMYLQLRYEYGNPSKVPSYDTNQLPKLITGITNLYTDGYMPVYVLEIDQQQGYIYHDLDELSWMDNRYSLVYIQRQQIYSVDKSIGTHQLNKITLDEPLDYNTFHNTNIETGLVSDNFDYGRVYIDPVKEFDSKLVPSAYINIAYTDDQLIDTYLDNIDTNFLSSYEGYSLACVQLTNYVSKTGECSLYSDLKFKPDRHYMYQIFVVDQSSNYNAADTNHKYKLYTGTNKHNEKVISDRFYLGGGKNIQNNTNTLPIYSNHQIGNTNQYMCFIQPNLGIYEDQYKPCMLQLYNNKYQHDLYITNYNGVNIYNKDYSIDKLDDSQWLVVLTYPKSIFDLNNDGRLDNKDENIMQEIFTSLSEGEYNAKYDFDRDKQITAIDTALLSSAIGNWPDATYYDQIKYAEVATLIQKPQTKYNIYTNFVNSIPEGYFYYRSNKTLEFEYYDFYTQKNLNEMGYKYYKGEKIIPRRDIIVQCKIYDDNDSSGLKNLVPIKYYKYVVAEVNPNNIDKINKIIYQSDALYDGKYQYTIKGLDNCYVISNNVSTENVKDNPILYRIQITAEDEYGQIYEYSEDVYFGYLQEIVTDRISASLDCQKQATHISFSPIKTFRGEGQISSLQNEDNNKYITIKGQDGLSYSSLQDDAGNILSLKNGEDFEFVTKLRIGDEMFEESKEHNVLSIITDDNTSNYTVKFDTRVYVKGTDKWMMNDEYLSFKLYKDNVFKQSVKVNCGFVMPNNFEYAFSSATTSNEQGVYFIEKSPDTSTVTNLNGAIDNLGGQADGQYDIPSLTSSQTYYIYDNNDADINANNKGKMGFLCLTLKVQDENITFNIKEG